MRAAKERRDNPLVNLVRPVFCVDERMYMCDDRVSSSSFSFLRSSVRGTRPRRAAIIDTFGIEQTMRVCTCCVFFLGVCTFTVSALWYKEIFASTTTALNALYKPDDGVLNIPAVPLKIKVIRR